MVQRFCTNVNPNRSDSNHFIFSEFRLNSYAVRTELEEEVVCGDDGRLAASLEDLEHATFRSSSITVYSSFRLFQLLVGVKKCKSPAV